MGKKLPISYDQSSKRRGDYPSPPILAMEFPVALYKQQLTGHHIALGYDDQFLTSDLLDLNKVLLLAAQRLDFIFYAKRLWAEFAYYQLVSDT
jgi:hypothetical protein